MRLINVLPKRRRDKSSLGSRHIEVFVEISTVETHTIFLPEDILYGVYEYAAIIDPPRIHGTKLPTPRARSRARLAWMTLTHVCRDWRAVGLSAYLAPLWARVACLTVSSRWNAPWFLERARSSPLTLDLTFDATRSGEKHHDWKSWTTMEWFAFQNIERAGTLIEPGRYLLDELKKKHLLLPMLREIRFGLNDLPDDFQPPWELPALNTLWLPRAICLFPPALVATLRELHLGVHASRISLSSLRTFLSACPYLEILDLSIVDEWTGDTFAGEDRQATSGGTLHLDRLKQAKIACAFEKSAVDFWASISGPPNASLHFALEREYYCWGMPVPVQMLMEACKPHMNCEIYDTMELRLPRGFVEQSTFDLRLSSSYIPTASCELSFPSDDAERQKALLTLSAYIPGASFRIKTLSFDQLVLGERAILETFGKLADALRSVEELRLVGMNAWYTLKHIRVLGNAKSYSLFPYLRTVTISNMCVERTPDNPEASQPWWGTITDIMSVRCDKFGLKALECIKLDGKWDGKKSWSDLEDREGRERIVERALVKDLIDERVWTG